MSPSAMRTLFTQHFFELTVNAPDVVQASADSLRAHAHLIGNLALRIPCQQQFYDRVVVFVPALRPLHRVEKKIPGLLGWGVNFAIGGYRRCRFQNPREEILEFELTRFQLWFISYCAQQH